MAPGRWSWVLGAVAGGILFALVSGAAAAQGPMASWLDRMLTPWNSAGGAVPSAVQQSVPAQAICIARERPPRDAEEAPLADNGWRFLDAWPARTVTVSDPPVVTRVTLTLATSGYDGMCRPIGFNAFVLVDGRFAGTLSPVPMDSRTDGVLRDEPTVLHGGRVEATFTRYAAADPLCCPSLAPTRVSYQLVRQPAGWVVLAEAATRVPDVPLQLPRTGARALVSPPAPSRAGTIPPAIVVAVAGVLAAAGVMSRRPGRPTPPPPPAVAPVMNASSGAV